MNYIVKIFFVLLNWGKWENHWTWLMDKETWVNAATCWACLISHLCTWGPIRGGTPIVVHGRCEGSSVLGRFAIQLAANVTEGTNFMDVQLPLLSLVSEWHTSSYSGVHHPGLLSYFTRRRILATPKAKYFQNGHKENFPKLFMDTITTMAFLDGPFIFQLNHLDWELFKRLLHQYCFVQ